MRQRKRLPRPPGLGSRLLPVLGTSNPMNRLKAHTVRFKGRRSMARNKNFQAKAQIVLNNLIQNRQIQNRFPQFKMQGRGDTVAWIGRLQPTDLSPVYTLQINYTLWKTPKVYVLSPALHPKAVHLYPDRHLCLYWPPEWDWKPDKLIANTIIPWSGSWLYYYEIWLDTGRWLGPSSHDYRPAK